MTAPNGSGRPGHDEEPVVIERGRIAPFSMIPDWVGLAGVSARAEQVYNRLAMHLNTQRGDRLVWPSMQTLAELCHVQKAKSLIPYIDELVQLGAIDRLHTTTDGGLNGRNTYRVHQTPPPGYRGPVALSDWYEQRQHAARRTPKPAGAGQRPSWVRGPESGTARRPSLVAEGETAGGAVVPDSGPRSPEQGPYVVPNPGLERDEPEPEPSVLPSTPAEGTEGRAMPSAQTGGGVRFASGPIGPGRSDAAAGAFASGLAAPSPAAAVASRGTSLLIRVGLKQPNLALAGKVLNDQAQIVTALIEAGWPEGYLEQVLAAPIERITKSAGAVIAARLRALPIVPPGPAPSDPAAGGQRPAGPRVDGRGHWIVDGVFVTEPCGTCDEYRWISDTDTEVMKCPRCHPHAMRREAAAAPPF